MNNLQKVNLTQFFYKLFKYFLMQTASYLFYLWIPKYFLHFIVWDFSDFTFITKLLQKLCYSADNKLNWFTSWNDSFHHVIYFFIYWITEWKPKHWFCCKTKAIHFSVSIELINYIHILIICKLITMWKNFFVLWFCFCMNQIL